MLTTFPPTPKEFAEDFLREVKELTSGGAVAVRRGEFTLWTDAAKHWLDERGRSFGLQPIYTDQRGSSEFLLDLVWWQDGPGGHGILACEMEWGNTRDSRRNPGRVAEDFDKLLSFKAGLKLMIFDSYGPPEIQAEVIKELNRYLREYGDHRSGEEYLLVDVRSEKAWLCTIPPNPNGVDLHFEQI